MQYHKYVCTICNAEREISLESIARVGYPWCFMCNTDMVEIIPKEKVIVFVSGGLVQSIFGSNNIEVSVFDADIFDTQEIDCEGRSEKEFAEDLENEQLGLNPIY